MADQRNGLHIVVFPWLAFGHMIPFLELSKGLARRGHSITFISTPRNIERLPKLPPNLSPLINFVKLTLPQHPNLPEGAEATSDLPLNKIQYLKIAFDGLDESFACFLETSASDLIIHDYGHHWVQPIASKHGVPCVFFSIFSASFIASLGSPWLRMEGEDTRVDAKHYTVDFLPPNMVYRQQKILKTSDSSGGNDSAISELDRYDSTALGSNFLIIRTCEEIEADSLSVLSEKIFRIPVIPIGLLPPSEEDTSENKDDEWTNIRRWLDKKKEKSVVYIAFGSEAAVSKEEIHEIALGLEQSGLPFFWVLRKPGRVSETDTLAMLPSGFKSRTEGQGFICSGWAPQRKILRHPSVGVFLTHCGWSSVIEALGIGCPLVLFPLSVDQPLVAKLLLSNDIGVEIPRDEKDGSFTRDSVAKSLRQVLVDTDGEKHLAKAKEMKQVFGNKVLHERYLDDFDQYLRTNLGC